MAEARNFEVMKVDMRSESEDESSYTAQTAEEKSLQLQTPPTPPPSPLPGSLQERQFLSDQQDRQTQLQTFLRPGTNIVNFQGSPTGIEQRRQYYRDSPPNSENGGVENPVNEEETVIQSAQHTRNINGNFVCVHGNGTSRSENRERDTSEVPKVPDRQNLQRETQVNYIAVSTQELIEISEENNAEPIETAVSTDVLATENSEDNNTETPDRCPNTVRGTQDDARRSENPERDIPEVQEEPDRQNALTETQEENYVLDLNENAENPDECLDTVDSFEPLIEGRSDLNANVSTVDVSHVAMVYRIMSNQSSPQNAFKYLLRNAGLRGNLFEAAVAEIYQAWRHVTQYAYSRVPALLNKVQESPGGLTTFLQLAVYKVQSLLALVEGNKDGLLDTLTKASALLTIPFQPGIATQLAYVYLHYGLACSEENQKKEWMMRAQTLFRQDSNDDADDGSTDDIEARCGADIVGHGLDECYQSAIPLYYEHQFYQFYKKLVQQPIIALAIDLKSCLKCIDRR